MKQVERSTNQAGSLGQSPTKKRKQRRAEAKISLKGQKVTHEYTHHWDRKELKDPPVQTWTTKKRWRDLSDEAFRAAWEDSLDFAGRSLQMDGSD